MTDVPKHYEIADTEMHAGRWNVCAEMKACHTTREEAIAAATAHANAVVMDSPEIATLFDLLGRARWELWRACRSADTISAIDEAFIAASRGGPTPGPREPVSTELESATAQLRVQSSMLDSYQADLAQLRSELESARSELTQARERIVALYSEAADASSEFARCCDAYSDEARKAREERDEARAWARKAGDERDAAIARMAGLEDERVMPRMLGARKLLETWLAAMGLGLAMVTEMAQARSRIAKTDSPDAPGPTSETPREKIAALEAERPESGWAKSAALARMARMELDIDGLRRSRQIAVDERTNAVAERDASIARVAELEAEHVTMSTELTEARNRIAALNADYENIQCLDVHISEDLDASIARVAELEAELNQAREKIKVWEDSVLEVALDPGPDYVTREELIAALQSSKWKSCRELSERLEKKT